ncbi:MAG: hypothetical protein WC385_02055 [Candidatus Paceibacterota bacterium]
MSLCLVAFALLALNVPVFIAFAANYQLLEPSVIINDGNTGESQPQPYGLQQYLRTAYFIFFVVVLAAVFLFFVIGGLEYIVSDIPMVKANGMKQLQASLVGLGIALSSYLLLKLINPDLVNLSFDFTLPS